MRNGSGFRPLQKHAQASRPIPAHFSFRSILWILWRPPQRHRPSRQTVRCYCSCQLHPASFQINFGALRTSVKLFRSDARFSSRLSLACSELAVPSSFMMNSSKAVEFMAQLPRFGGLPGSCKASLSPEPV